MSRSSDAANSVVKAVLQVCDLYRVPRFRTNSRTLTVPGRNGKDRPMFFGTWTDDFGIEHKGGMADVLAIPFGFFTSRPFILWIEAKYGAGRLTKEQELFRDYVQSKGMHWIEARDSADAVVEWFKMQGVIR